MKKTTRARCEPKKCVDGIALSADHKIPNVENESRGGHKKKRYSRAKIISRIGSRAVR